MKFSDLASGGETDLAKEVTPASQLHILDPACGDGVFLFAAAGWLWERYGNRDAEPGCERMAAGIDDRPEVAARVNLIRRHLYGVDTDARAVEAARWRLAWWAETGDEPPAKKSGQRPASCDSTHPNPSTIQLAAIARWSDLFRHNIRCADALIDQADWEADHATRRDRPPTHSPSTDATQTTSAQQHPSPAPSLANDRRKAVSRQRTATTSAETPLDEQRERFSVSRMGDVLARDAFLDHTPAPSRICWQAAFPDIFARGGFDVVIGNPPYINIRLLTQTQGSVFKAYYQRRYQCARGAYDIFVLFLERMLELLREGGRGGVIVPNKLATLNYALPCRQLLVQTTALEQICDATECQWFIHAHVYPYILIWQKERPAEQQQITIRSVRNWDDLQTTPSSASRGSWRILQSSLARSTSWQLHGGVDVESRVPTKRLSDCAQTWTGTSGFSAKRVAAALVERASLGHQPGFRFIVSGNIDRYAIELGDVRFSNQRWYDPCLPVHHPVLTPTKRRLYVQPKLLLAGLSRTLEAAYDPGGLAAGVQVYMITSQDEQLCYLLAILNSRLITQLFKLRFQAKKLADGYLAINKRQLDCLPIRHIAAHDRSAQMIRAQILERVEPLIGQANRCLPLDPTLPFRTDVGSADYPSVASLHHHGVTAIDSSVPVSAPLSAYLERSTTQCLAQSSDLPASGPAEPFPARLVTKLAAEHDEEVDRLVGQLYGLTQQEIDALLVPDEGR
jgi:hypothetical protein